MLAGIFLAAALTLEMVATTAGMHHVDVHVGSPEAIVALAKELGMDDHDRVMGMARWSDTACEIYVPPLTVDTVVIWLHEFRHCTEGYFHGSR